MHVRRHSNINSHAHDWSAMSQGTAAAAADDELDAAAAAAPEAAADANMAQPVTAAAAAAEAADDEAATAVAVSWFPAEGSRQIMFEVGYVQGQR